jgi:hypothetical protein
MNKSEPNEWSARSPDEIIELGQKEVEALKKLCVFDSNGDIVIMAAPTAPYVIELDQINTDQKVISWLLHMIEKKWFTMKHMQALMLRLKEKGIVRYGSI